MKKKIYSKTNQAELEKEVFQKVKAQYDWAMKQSAECHFPWMPYFQQYFFSNMQKPDFNSTKVKDVLYIKALRHFKILPNEGESCPTYMYNALETKFGKDN